MATETSRRFSRVRENIGRGRRFELAGKMGPELEVAVLVARVFGTRGKFLTRKELEITIE